MLHEVENAIEHRKLFVRHRKSNWLRALGVVLYHLGLSLRDTSLVLDGIGGASHETVRKWYARCRNIFTVETRSRRVIAVDEIKVRGKWMFLWAAIDIDSWEILFVWVSQGRSGLEAISFLRKAGTQRQAYKDACTSTNGDRMEKQPCAWCGDLYTRRGIRLHEIYCPKNPSSPKYKPTAQESAPEAQVPAHEKGVLESLGLLKKPLPTEVQEQSLTESKSSEKGLMDRLIEELDEEETSEDVELPWEDSWEAFEKEFSEEPQKTPKEQLERIESTVMELQDWYEKLQIEFDKHLGDTQEALVLEKEALHSELELLRGAIKKLEESNKRRIEIVHKEEPEPKEKPAGKKPKKIILVSKKEPAEVEPGPERGIPIEPCTLRDDDPTSCLRLDNEMKKTLHAYRIAFGTQR